MKDTHGKSEKRQTDFISNTLTFLLKQKAKKMQKKCSFSCSYGNFGLSSHRTKEKTS